MLLPVCADVCEDPTELRRVNNRTPRDDIGTGTADEEEEAEEEAEEEEEKDEAEGWAAKEEPLVILVLFT